MAKNEIEYACCCDGMEEAISMGGIFPLINMIMSTY